MDLITRKMDLLANMQGLQKAAVDYIRDSKSDNTIRAYAADWDHFKAWCDTYRVVSLPAAAETVALYITDLAEGITDYKASVATIQRRLVAISQRHKAEGCEVPTQAQAVKSVMAGIRRSVGVHQDKKLPILTEHIRSWAAVLPAGVTSIRDRALILLGYAGAFRRSELVALDVSNLEFTKSGVKVTIKRSKTDQDGAGYVKAVYYGSDPAVCPVLALQDWLKFVQSGPLFRRVWQNGRVDTTRLSDKVVDLVVKDLCQSIGLDADLYGAHSLRAGHITQAKINGAADTDIMRQSGHKSMAVFAGYIRDADLFRNNSSGRLGL